MSSRRFFLSAPPEDGKAILIGEEAHHLTHVLRANPGRAVELIDGSGRIWNGIVGSVEGDRVLLENIELLSSKAAPAKPVSLIQSLCKLEKLEWILQKTTELGVSEIYLLQAERSILRIPKERIETRMERWRKIALAASKQSRRSTVPTVHLPGKPAELSRLVHAELRLLFSENEQGSPLKNILRESAWHSASVCIGPEGGWTPREERIFGDAGFRCASLGTAILRTETAAIVATAILKYELDQL
jgi:16S rRNA (uracil1498-N3)-methyltransferase